MYNEYSDAFHRKVCVFLRLQNTEHSKVQMLFLKAFNDYPVNKIQKEIIPTLPTPCFAFMICHQLMINIRKVSRLKFISTLCIMMIV